MALPRTHEQEVKDTEGEAGDEDAVQTASDRHFTLACVKP
jgi:hypothetical protein